MKKLLLSSVFVFVAMAMMAQDCNDLFFSEYVEGSANNKTLEIYNPTNNAIDLSTYVIKRYSNGSPVPTEELALSGTIQPKDVVVVTNGQTDSIWVTSGGGYWSLPISEELYAKGDLHCSGIYPTPMYFNGDDAMTLETVTGGVIDIFGKIGEQPENGWNDIPPTYVAGAQYWTSWTIDHTVIRKFSVKKGVTANPAPFMINVEWDSIAKDNFDSLGHHSCGCGQTGIGETPSSSNSFVIYPNPATGHVLYINAKTGWYKVEILTVTGNLVKEAVNGRLSTEGRIDVADLTPGMYIARITFPDEKTAMSKILIQ
jgi:hypothetical protein